MGFRRIVVALTTALIVVGIESGTASAQTNECQSPSAPCVGYIAGGGGATDEQINQRVAAFKFIFQQLYGELAGLKVFRPDTSITVAGQTLRYYSASAKSEIVGFMNSLQGGPNRHVISASAGAVVFREDVIPNLTSKDFGVVVEVEPMFPGASPPTTPIPGYNPLLHVTLESQYTGAFANAFNTIFGVAGSTVPGCSPPGCYYIPREGAEIRSPLDFDDGIARHGAGTGEGENAAGIIVSSVLREGSTAPTQARLDDLIAGQPPQGPPSQPPNPGGPPPISGGGGGGGGAAGGGGVGVESYPTWLTLEEYEAGKEKAVRR